MQGISNVRRDSINSESKTTNDASPTPPPPYRTVMDKWKNSTESPSFPPSYTDIDNPSVMYVNNYPGPPLSDGVVQINTASIHPMGSGASRGYVLSKKMRTYLLINGVITIFFGCTAIGLQIGLIASHSIVYYYYGFWAGALIISIGVSTILFNHRYQNYDLTKYFRSFLCQCVLVAVVFGFGLIIILTDTCDEQPSENDGSDDACKKSYRFLNSFLVTVIALTLAQTIVNTFVIGCTKKRNSNRLA